MACRREFVTADSAGRTYEVLSIAQLSATQRRHMTEEHHAQWGLINFSFGIHPNSVQSLQLLRGGRIFN